MTHFPTINLPRLTRTAALLYLLITGVAIYTHFILPGRLIVPGNGPATVNNLSASLSTFRVGSIGGEMIILLSEVVLTVLLYIMFRRVSRTLALLALTSRLLMTGIHAANLVTTFALLQGLDGPLASALTSTQREAMTLSLYDAHQFGFTVGVAFLAIHAAALGWLMIRSGFVPKLLGGLFFLAAAGYLLNSFSLLLGVYEQTPAPIALVIALSEVAFPLWLLVRGIDAARWHIGHAPATLQPQR